MHWSCTYKLLLYLIIMLHFADNKALCRHMMASTYQDQQQYQHIQSLEVEACVKPSTSCNNQSGNDWTQYLLMAIHFLTEGFVYEYPQPPAEAHRWQFRCTSVRLFLLTWVHNSCICQCILNKDQPCTHVIGQLWQYMGCQEYNLVDIAEFCLKPMLIWC